jgi:hypothetical protein
MYRDVAQWHLIRRRIREDGTPKKQVSRETGISRLTINRMLMHECPPGYGPRPPNYPKLGPYTPVIDRLLAEAATVIPASRMTIQDIVEHLRRNDGFTGSYGSVQNYVQELRTSR